MFTTSVAGRTWRFRNALGRDTAEDNDGVGGFAHPVDVAVAPDGILFVLSRGFGYSSTGPGFDMGKRIGKMTIDERHLGDFARKEFTWPVGIAVSGDGNVYCSDEYENIVTIFSPDVIHPYPEYDPDGESIDQWGEAGAAPGHLGGPAGIAFDQRDNLYVVDSLNDRVQQFTKDGRFITGWGGTGDRPGRFQRPWGVTVDMEGSVYVADWGNDRVQKFSADGEFLMTFGSSVESGGDLRHPASVAVDSEGDVYVTDWGNRRVQIYEPDGEVLTALYGDATGLTKAGEYLVNRDKRNVGADIRRRGDPLPPEPRFMRPVGIAVDGEDRIIVTDVRCMLHVYAKVSPTESPESKEAQG